VTRTGFVNRYGDEAWAKGNFSVLPELLTEDFVGHIAGRDRGVEGLKTDIELFRAHHPNLHIDRLEQFETDDRVISRLRIYSAGKVAYGMNISRFDGDRIAEEWAVWTEFE
jgi:SnoaL-like polyketide cyclase